METAFALANHWHMNINRKGTKIPYISHLMAVSALVLEYGGSLDQASAGLLHDILEDTKCSEEALVNAVGSTVTQIVKSCTQMKDDNESVDERRLRKQQYIDKLTDKSRNPAANLVALADKVHNAECTLKDWNNCGRDKSQMFKEFSDQWDGQKLWYESLSDAFESLDVPVNLYSRLKHAVSEIFGDHQ